MAFAGFGKNTGPSVIPNSNTPFGSFLSSNPNFSPKHNSNSDTYRSPSHDNGSSVSASQSHQKQLTPTRAERSVTPHSWDNQLRSHPYPVNPQNMSSPAFNRTTSDGISNTSIKANGHDTMKKTNRPAVPLTWGNLGRSPIALSANTQGVEPNVRIKPKSFGFTKPTRSPPFSSDDEDILGLYSIPDANDRRLSTSPISNTQSRKQNNFHSVNHKRMSPVVNDASTQSAVVHSRSDSIDAYVIKRNRSPSFHSQVDDFEESETQNHSTGSVRRHEVSTPRSFNKNKGQVFAAANTELMPISTNLNSSKRHRSPPSQAVKMESISSSNQLDSEREIQAKAKRLARFNVELRQPMQTPEEIAKRKFSGNRLDQTIFVKQKIADNPSEEPLNNMSSEVISDNEVIESSKVIVGQCSDMCPESERDERERKGDLDKYERLNGERNQTSKSIAVKKYTRTAERDAYLIRPLPILRMTVDYLLSLLDQPYNENFLGIYNFLWDRMRAVRMDLRMQHIFNQDAILMLEQMIRLHILAMHELCEYKKGEGFTEGFDAHLNIEQMNKTSVELFQLYDDHRKQGKNISTEREFRGYYALLKLDKHPGYKVEPSELSLDLAKMTSEMRCTPEVLFARNVARACRTGNYIAFFRLARKATYLQSCLMHAHFAKLRTQALASLHSGLQINQGIPVSHIVNWLGLEGEVVESLLEFHGFALRKYEEMYMVKEGSFLNGDSDYAVKRSPLVHLKKSKNIVDDVRSGPLSSEIKMEREKKVEAKIADVKTSTLTRESWVRDIDEMVGSKVDYIPKLISMPQQTIEKPVEKKLNDLQEDHEMSNVLPVFSNVDNNFEMIESSPKKAKFINDEIGSKQEQTVECIGKIGMNRIIEAGVPATLDEDSMMESQFVENDTTENGKEEASTILAQQKEEAFREKLKLIIRKWKERSSVLRELREQKEYLANLALSSLSLGPPIRRQSGMQTSFVNDDLNFDHVAIERFHKMEKSQARLNVAEMTLPILSSRNRNSECVVWKLLLLVHANEIESQTYTMALKWLRSKVMASDVRPDKELLVSSPGLSVWMHTSPSQASCLSIIKESSVGEEDDSISGSCCSLFLTSGRISWNKQRIQIQKLVNSIPYGASLPLLILVTDTSEEAANVINQLGLHEADREKICSTSVVFLSTESFFDDDKLIEGLQWLARNSPLQPKLQVVDTRELVMSNLRNSITAFENTVIEPNHCISAFNEALKNSAEQISAAASANPSNWPAPEINTIKCLNLNLNLPSIGWSSDEKIDPIVSAIRQCMLPSSSNEMAWMNQNSPQDQKLAIEDFLANYLTQSRLLSYDLAVREASIMLQSNASLELRGTRHYIIPRWFNIFQRIFNWQLMKLRRNELSEAYVLENKIDNQVEEYRPLSYVQSETTLDEMMDISCNVPFMEQKNIASENQYTSLDLGTEISDGEKAEMEASDNECSGFELPVSSESENRLEMLFEKCKLVQDRIAAKLSIYGCNL